MTHAEKALRALLDALCVDGEGLWVANAVHAERLEAAISHAKAALHHTQHERDRRTRRKARQVAALEVWDA